MSETESGINHVKEQIVEVWLDDLVGGTHLSAVRHVCETRSVHVIREEPTSSLDLQVSQCRLKQLNSSISAEEVGEVLVFITAIARIAVALNKVSHYTRGPLLELQRK